MSVQIVKYLAGDGLFLPNGTPMSFGLDENGDLAVWLLHTPPIEVDNPTLSLYLKTEGDGEFNLRGTFVGSAVHDMTVWHLFNAGTT